MIKVVSFKICPFVQRVTALLEAKKIPYEIEYINLSDKPEWFLDISPVGQVPVLITEDGTPLFESDAIAEYLDDKYEPLNPEISPERRAAERAWSYQASKHYLVQCSAMSSGSEDVLHERSAKLSKAFARAETVLQDGPYFWGEEFSNVDIAWLPLLHRAAIISQKSGFDFLDKFPKVKKWQRHMLATGLAEKSVSEDFEFEFSKFYLSKKTYLGRGCVDLAAHSKCGAGQPSSCCG